jgi:hypothetical protein
MAPQQGRTCSQLPRTAPPAVYVRQPRFVFQQFFDPFGDECREKKFYSRFSFVVSQHHTVQGMDIFFGTIQTARYILDSDLVVTR